MAAQLARMERLERLHRHGRSEVAAADADVDHVGEPLARCARAGAVVDFSHELRALGALGQHFGVHALKRRRHRRACGCAQQRVQRRPAFRVVDDGAVHERIDLTAQVYGLGQGHQRIQRAGVESLAREVQQQAVELAGEILEARRVGSEQLADG